MRRTSTLFLLLLGGYSATAQCTSAVPANAQLITSDVGGVVPGNGINFWVCGTAFQQVFTGNNNHFWVEAPAWISVNGTGNTVHFKGFGLALFGSNNTVYAETTGSVLDQGSSNTVNACGDDAVIFTYGSAPSGGCAVGIGELALPEVVIQPNPVQDVLTLEPGSAIVRQVRICDLEGREVLDLVETNPQQIAVSRFDAGTYVMRVHTDQGITVRRFVKM